MFKTKIISETIRGLKRILTFQKGKHLCNDLVSPDLTKA